MYSAGVEYLLRALCLSLLGAISLIAPSRHGFAVTFATMLAGLAGGMIATAIICHRNGARLRGQASTLLFLLLARPRVIHLGALMGLSLGLTLTTIGSPMSGERAYVIIHGAALVGINLGLVLTILRQMPNRWGRICVAGMLGIMVTASAILIPERFQRFFPEIIQGSMSLYVVLALGFYWSLTWVGLLDRSEGDAALWCAMLAYLIWLNHPTAIGLTLPLVLYLVYVVRLMPRVNAHRYYLRGISYDRVGLHAHAFAWLSHAAAQNRFHRATHSALWDVHRRIDPGAMGPEVYELIDARLCLDRAAALLNEPPSPDQLKEATRLLDLAEKRQPDLGLQFRYWRAVAATHDGMLDLAERLLNECLDAPANAVRQSLLVPIWQLMLLLHPGLESTAGRRQLEIPGRRLEAIAAAERVLAESPQDATGWSLKRILYPPLTMADFSAGPVAEFDFHYVEQLGLAQINDPAKRSRGKELLTVAASGLPSEAPRLWLTIAEAMTAAGDVAAAQKALEKGKQAGIAVAVKQLSPTAQQAYFTIVRTLADAAEQAGQLDEAATNLSLFAESDRSGLETLRRLADVHERRGDIWSALHSVERARVYDPRDVDLLTRRDKYIYSIQPSALRQATSSQRSCIDAHECLDKARKLIDIREADADLLHWARHLIELARVLMPQDIAGRILAARVQLRLGESKAALQLLEDLREQKPEKFASTEEEECWLLGNRLLADIYLNDLDRADLAVGCLLDYRKSSKSGADTLYKLGVAFERLNERGKSANYYEQAAGYEGHPIAAEARAGLQRVR